MTTQQKQSSPTTTLLVAATLLSALLLMVLPPASDASSIVFAQDPVPEDVTVFGALGTSTFFTGPAGYFYGSQDSPYTVTTGNPIDAVCADTPPQTIGTATRNEDGTWTSRIPGWDYLPVFVYENPTDDFMETFPTLCPPIVEGEPGPEPIAMGWVRLTARVTKSTPFWSFIGPQPEGHYVNSISGWAWDDDGTRYKIRARADYIVAEDGPPDFDELSLNVEAVE